MLYGFTTEIFDSNISKYNKQDEKNSFNKCRITSKSHENSVCIQPRDGLVNDISIKPLHGLEIWGAINLEIIRDLFLIFVITQIRHLEFFLFLFK